MTRLLLLVLAALLSTGCDQKTPAPPTPTDLAPSSGKLVKVEPSTVCMVTDRLMRAPQIPVSVGGRTYYGCCDGCKKRLATDASVRSATDPITGRAVDKASAVTASDASGAVLYFESEASFRTYQGS